MGDLARRWLDEHVAVRCKPKTVEMYALIVRKHLLPAFGKVPAPALDHARVTGLHHSLRATPLMANRTVDVLSRIWNAAEDRGQLPEASNPCRLVVKNRERKRERFLSEEEFRRLGKTLAEAETRKGVSVHAVAAIRLLLLTGCRRNEILTLRWRNVDLEARELKLEDSKTGARVVPLLPEAADVLANIPHIEGNPWVIPGKLKGKRMRNLNDPWELICERAKIENARLHDCWHSFASGALALGEGLPMIGRLLGHTQVKPPRAMRTWRSTWCANPPSAYPTASRPKSSGTTGAADRRRRSLVSIDGISGQCHPAQWDAMAHAPHH